MARGITNYIAIATKGLAMGAADVVPGVSGGTIAFITGIYEEFINSLKSINLDALKKLKTDGIKGFWEHINGWFLLSLFTGIGISIISLAKGITYLLSEFPVLIWSFFLGLILASSVVIAKNIKKWSIGAIIAMLAGAGIAFYITIVSPAETTTDSWFVFLSGMIAICAMILPGISGSFILLLMGKYKYIFTALSTMDFKVIITFATGCVAGLLSFSHVLSWMFKRYHDLTIALLTGFMIGSLRKVWPWQITTKWRTNSHGEEVPFLQEPVLPADYLGESYVVGAVVLAITAIILIFVLERAGKKHQNA